jgi:hypothetical protein
MSKTLGAALAAADANADKPRQQIAGSILTFPSSLSNISRGLESLRHTKGQVFTAIADQQCVHIPKYNLITDAKFFVTQFWPQSCQSSAICLQLQYEHQQQLWALCVMIHTLIKVLDCGDSCFTGPISLVGQQSLT